MTMMVATTCVFIDMPTKTNAKIDDLALLVGLGIKSLVSLAHVPSPT